MGRTLTATKGGQCPECETSYGVGETIYWDKDVKNSKGYSVTCKNKECFEEQGGKITGYQSKFTPKPKVGFRKSEAFPDRQLTANPVLEIQLPSEVTANPAYDSAAPTLEYLIVVADDMAKRFYPKLEPSSQTFGQIRSKLIDQLIALNKG